MKRMAIWLVMIGSPVYSQDIVDSITNSSKEIKEYIAELEALSGLTIEQFVANARSAEEALDSHSIDENADAFEAQGIELSLPWPAEYQNVDFGYAVLKADGSPIDLFGPNTPVTQSNNISENVVITGYDIPEDATVQVVGKVAYNELNQEIINEMRKSNAESAVGVGISEIAKKVIAATDSLLIEICQKSYYPAEMKLYMNAGFDFVIVNSGTGSELSFVFKEQCGDFLSFLREENEKYKNKTE